MMPEGIDKFIRPDLKTFSGYSSAKSPDTLKGETEVAVEDIIKLDANENLYGCSPRVNRALANYTSLNIYPDAGQTELRKLLEGYTGISAEHIVCGSGSDELIDIALRLFVGFGDAVINCVPTFEMFRFSTLINGGEIVEAPRDDNFIVDASAVKAAITNKTKIILIANPNNPTGTITPQDTILEIIETGLPVVVDEAYYEFSGETVAPLVDKYSNLMVLRTFSKWAGLAGLRIGYGIFPTETASYLMTIKHPYNVNSAAQVAARESLKDIDYLMGTVKATIEERERLFSKLKKLTLLKPFPSQTNFIFCTVLKGEAKELQQKMQNKGILVRHFDQPFWRNGIRISVGKPEHTDALIKMLQKAEEEVSDR